MVARAVRLYNDMVGLLLLCTRMRWRKESYEKQTSAF